MPIDAKVSKTLPEAPNIDDSLRNPANEAWYVAEYFQKLANQAMPVLSELVKDDPEKEALIRSILEGKEGSTIVSGQVAKALAESGLLKAQAVVRHQPEELTGKTGWFEWKTDNGGNGNEPGYSGVVESYKVVLPESAGQAPVTKTVRLEVQQPKIDSSTDPQGRSWGDINYDKWTLVCG